MKIKIKAKFWTWFIGILLILSFLGLFACGITWTMRGCLILGISWIVLSIIALGVLIGSMIGLLKE